ncbi:hypothetical protein APS_0795 [Acetobacter pasteurianus subsp. pasteurianus LMG 1262 = NBRC 106471]|nr:hypothetical protein APS_0795 [Acetobacter pasteurianus subsp. pasteurianus LMG 1262 = NBRC 106471]
MSSRFLLNCELTCSEIFSCFYKRKTKFFVKKCGFSLVLQQSHANTTKINKNELKQT